MSVKKDTKRKTWYCRVSYKDNDGKYKQMTRKGFNTKQEATIAEVKLLEQIENGFSTANKNISLGDYFEQWIDRYVGDNYTRGTRQVYDHDLKLVKDFFGVKPISKITRSDYQDFITKRGKKHAIGTVIKTHSHVKQCLKDAVYDNLIDRDPTYKINLSAKGKSKSEQDKFLSEAEVTKLLDYVQTNFEKHPVPYLMIIIGIATGMRFGEILGLAWNDINFTDKTISIKRSYNYVSEHTFTKGKTMSAHRTITIEGDVIHFLKRYKLMSNRKYLFIDRTLRPIVSHNTVKKHLNRAINELEISKVTFHSLRHTHASILIYKGININYISKRLGHKSVSTTNEVYSHVIDELEQKENDKVKSILEKMAK